MDIDNVVKGGRDWFMFGFDRGRLGLEIRVKVLPEVENFIRDLGDGGTDPLAAYGKNWYSPEGRNLFVYKMNRTGGEIMNPYGPYTLENINHDLIQQGSTQINLSFLRIQGISEGAGVAVGFKGPYSPAAIREIRGRLGAAARQLARDYMVPFSTVLTISSQE